ncbi:MAG: T9SS type A sorting domain-containing protein, partial [Tannerella sp.]|nr:T9SS type A sorting domain-containing protein [Tannerella sp.]
TGVQTCALPICYVLEQVVQPWTISFGPELASRTTGNEAVVSTAKVWSSGGKLHIASAITGEARIYNVTGMLVKIQPYIAGETSKTTLSGGIYFVVMEGKTWKVVM